MSHTVLLYGATGYSGRLIAAEAADVGMNAGGRSDCRMVLAGRNGREVSTLAARHGMDHRVFRIEDREELVRGLDGIDVVINAAGPFALTADHLVRGALAAGAHYVDINGEPEVFMALDDIGRSAIHRDRAIVSSAGYNAAASDLLLSVALQHLRRSAGTKKRIELTAVRLAFSDVTTLSRGSLETLWRSLREQVRIIRLADVKDLDGQPQKTHVIWHEPIGRLERTFDFRDEHRPREQEERIVHTGAGVASAANLVDTLTARLTVERGGFLARRIESYVQVGTIGRLAYQLAPLLAPLAAVPLARDVARLQLAVLPVGPTEQERAAEPRLIVLEIEDPFQTRVVHWAWHTPNPYDFTARVAVEVAAKVAGTSMRGWLTPSEVLEPVREHLDGRVDYLRGCGLTVRHG
jgi:short subunit dehydrogenase-like uncharacterized protein